LYKKHRVFGSVHSAVRLPKLAGE